jgi:hypothetical protein
VSNIYDQFFSPRYIPFSHAAKIRARGLHLLDRLEQGRASYDERAELRHYMETWGQRITRIALDVLRRELDDEVERRKAGWGN